MLQQDDPLAEQVRARIAPEVETPQGRFALREAFYRKYGFGSDWGYGSSELAFLKWEMDRGVLNPPAATPRGSAWWRAVNLSLIEDAEYAAAFFESGASSALTGSADHWLTYLRTPSAVTWYRAHNASIVSGYLRHADLASAENKAEQIFANIVLYRVLFAQAMVEAGLPEALSGLAERLATKLAALQKAVADPDGHSVDLVVHVPSFYPRAYPLVRKDASAMLGLTEYGGWRPQVLFDKTVGAVGLGSLYELASQWLGMPELLHIVVNHSPIYPIRITPAPAHAT
jgi:hypothetical protein